LSYGHPDFDLHGTNLRLPTMTAAGCLRLYFGNLKTLAARFNIGARTPPLSRQSVNPGYRPRPEPYPQRALDNVLGVSHGSLAQAPSSS
jgi:hypothetical protein